MPRAEAAAARYCCMYAPSAFFWPPPVWMLGSVHGVWLASLVLIASACVCVIWPDLTSSARVSAIAFWKAELIWAWVLLISTAKCFMNVEHCAEDELASTAVSELCGAECDAEGRLKLRVMPDAEAVTAMAATPTATAPIDRP